MLFSKKYKIRIPEPCHENWENMKPGEKGRFCDSCAKNVIDFTKMTDREIGSFFRNRPADVCGRFKNTQIEKSYSGGQQLSIPVHKRFWSFLISFFVSNMVVNKMIAQTDTLIVAENDSLKNSADIDSIPPDTVAAEEAIKITISEISVGSIAFEWIPEVPTTVVIYMGLHSQRSCCS
jgi:hypothetical protein